MAQAAGSWSVDACCAVPGNDCDRDHDPPGTCIDRASSSDWLFGLWPGPPQRFEPTGTDTDYQLVSPDRWPIWGSGVAAGTPGDLGLGYRYAWWPPGGPDGSCDQGGTYRGTPGEICGGGGNWGATDVEVWYPLSH